VVDLCDNVGMDERLNWKTMRLKKLSSSGGAAVSVESSSAEGSNVSWTW
jgi:hypothetical protein